MFVCLFRLEAIAADAELQEKSLSELQRLMTVLREGCVQAEEEHRVKYVWLVLVDVWGGVSVGYFSTYPYKGFVGLEICLPCFSRCVC